MAKTAQLDLPLLMPSQAQKHVTVNEALARLDALAQLRVVSSTVGEPPVTEQDGTSYLVPGDATGDWVGKGGKIAIWSNGGWLFVSPKAGWRAWDESGAEQRIFDGVEWLADAVTVSSGGAATVHRVLEFDHAVTPGGSNSTSVAIPAFAQVLGVTGRVIETLQGSGLTTWQLGVADSPNRYAAGLGVAEDSYLLGLSGQPVTYYTATPLRLTAQGGSFLSGKVRLAIHVLQLRPPRIA